MNLCLQVQLNFKKQYWVLGLAVVISRGFCIVSPAERLRLAEDGTGPMLLEILGPSEAWPSLPVSDM